MQLDYKAGKRFALAFIRSEGKLVSFLPTWLAVQGGSKTKRHTPRSPQGELLKVPIVKYINWLDNGVKIMFNPGMIDKVSDEQNRRIREQQSIAQGWNQVERKPRNLFGWIRSIFASLSRKKSKESMPVGEISQTFETQSE